MDSERRRKTGKRIAIVIGMIMLAAYAITIPSSIATWADVRKENTRHIYWIKDGQINHAEITKKLRTWEKNLYVETLDGEDITINQKTTRHVILNFEDKRAEELLKE